jgi:hypothetical protein
MLAVVCNLSRKTRRLETPNASSPVIRRQDLLKAFRVAACVKQPKVRETAASIVTPSLALAATGSPR